MLRHCYRGRGKFPLRDLVQKRTPIGSEGNDALYTAEDEYEIQSLTYFAASVIWRASACDWQIKGQRYERIGLGRVYGEEIRQYLLGNTGFPQHASLSVVVSALNTPALAFSFPDSVRADSMYCHRFHIPGVSFLFNVGKNAAQDAAESCIVRSPYHPIFISGAGDAKVQREVLKLMGKVAPRWGEYPLAEGFESYKR